MPSLHSSLIEETAEIIAQHLDELEPYVSTEAVMLSDAPENVLLSLERLSTLCQCSPEHASQEQYHEASAAYNTLIDFLRAMNQPMDSSFKETQFGHMLTIATCWRRIAGLRFGLSTHQVWDLIAPAQPDTLEALGNGRYEARWWKPVPVMDIEILRYTDGIIAEEPYEPPTLSGGIALRFSVSASGRGHWNNAAE